MGAYSLARVDESTCQSACVACAALSVDSEHLSVGTVVARAKRSPLGLATRWEQPSAGELGLTAVLRRRPRGRLTIGFAELPRPTPADLG